MLLRAERERVSIVRAGTPAPHNRIFVNNEDAKVEHELLSRNRERTIAGISEDAALALLRDPGISVETLSSLARSPVTVKSRKVMLGLVQHPRTPRHVSVPLLRRMFTFDLMQVTLAPMVVADVKRAAEEQIILRAESLPTGQ